MTKKFLLITAPIIFGIYILCFAQYPGSQITNTNIYTSEEQYVNGFSNTFLGVDYAEPYIAMNPRDPLNIFCPFTYSSYITTNGLDWRKMTIPCGGDPFATFDSLGNLYYSSLNTNMNYMLRKSTDKGATWNIDYILAPWADKECIHSVKSGGTYSNYVYTSWALSNNTTVFARSTNLGVNWSNVNMGNVGYPTYLTSGPSITYPNGILYMTYNNYSGSMGYIKLRKSTDGGVTFLPEIIVTSFVPTPILKNDSVLASPFFHMTADNSFGSNRGNVYIIYHAWGQGNDMADIYFTKSTNYGENWSNPVKLNDDNTTTDQFMTALAVDRNGKIFAAWYDSRIDPVNNRMTLMYGTVSSNGGVSFAPDFPISTTPFSPASMASSLGSLTYYIGHYIGASAINNTAIVAWTDGRNNNWGSYVGYFPDFALKSNPEYKNLLSHDSVIITVSIPAVRGPYNDRVNFSAELDSLPASGNINLSFINGKDFITTIPDSVKIKVSLNGDVTPGFYKLNITAGGQDGMPVHRKIVKLFINYSMLSIGTNRNGIAEYKVNGVSYTSFAQITFPNNSLVTVQAVSPNYFSNNKYVFSNWSDEGDTTHTILLNNSYVNLTANYKVQFKVHIISPPNSVFGSDIYRDSGTASVFGVLSRRFIYNGNTYIFRGWTGNGNGSYTSPDSSGVDSVVTLTPVNYITETPRWLNTTGINITPSDIPKEYKLYDACPNPFNSSTKISYSIPKNSDVKLKIYDVLGREVRTLVNEHQTAGNYVTAFNSGSLSSGVYFYRLTAGDYSDIKRMVVIK